MKPPKNLRANNSIAASQNQNIETSCVHVQNEILSPLNFSLNDIVSDRNVMMVDKTKKRLIEPENFSTSFQTLTPDSSLDKEFSGLTIRINPFSLKGEI